MLASGALSPLPGFMGAEDYRAVVDDMRLANGLPWALPVCLAVYCRPERRPCCAGHESGRKLAVLDVEGVFDYDREREAEQCFRTTDGEHPGVARLYEQADRYLAGRYVFERVASSFPDLHKDPKDTRAIFAKRGWRRVVGFQTRNPIHRAHEYLTKCALETVDGLLIHPLVGETKSDDVPAAVRVRPTTSSSTATTRGIARLSTFPACDALRGATRGDLARDRRKNYGCSHFIVGRDHAGVGWYYGTYDAQLIFDEFEPHELDIEPMFFEHSFWCKPCGRWPRRRRARTRPTTMCSYLARGCVRCSRTGSFHGGIHQAPRRRGADRGVPLRVNAFELSSAADYANVWHGIPLTLIALGATSRSTARPDVS